jgi:hypothetical protein
MALGPFHRKLDTAGAGAAPARMLIGGHDFFSSPRLSPDTRWLLWLSWDTPTCRGTAPHCISQNLARRKTGRPTTYLSGHGPPLSELGGTSYAPMSNPPNCGRVTPRWSQDSEVPGSALLNAGLVGRIAIVGVFPRAVHLQWLQLRIVRSHHSRTPEPLFMIKLPAPLTFMLPVKKHSFYALQRRSNVWQCKRNKGTARKLL